MIQVVYFEKIVLYFVMLEIRESFFQLKKANDKTIKIKESKCKICKH